MQSADHRPRTLFEATAETTLVTGYEERGWPALEPFLPEGVTLERDHLGNRWARLGEEAGPPELVLAAPADEAGFVVSRITDDGTLRLQSVGPLPSHPLWLRWHQGRKVEVLSSEGPLVGAVAAPSVHLRRGRRGTASDEPPGLDELWVDVGAASREEAEALGVRLLDPVALRKRLVPLHGERVAAPGLGRRWGAAVLLELLRLACARPPSRDLLFLWLGQEIFGRRGIDAAAERWRGADEVVLLGIDPSANRITPPAEGGPVLWTVEDRQEEAVPPDGWQTAVYEEGSLAGSIYTGGPYWGQTRIRHLTVPVEHVGTTAEVLSLDDVRAVARRLASETGLEEEALTGLAAAGPMASAAEVDTDTHGGVLEPLARLVALPGLSGHEGPVREAIRELLPSWALDHLEEDEEGNLTLDPAGGKHAEEDRPRIHFVAHMDEIGYEVDAVDADGRLRLRRRGGFPVWMFEGNPVLVRAASGLLPGIIAPRRPEAEDVGHEDLRCDVGARSAEEACALVAEGDPLVPLKELHRLGAHRASTRSFDDRVGCTALVLALREIDPASLRHRVAFTWAVREEVGLEGAKHLAATRPAPEYVFAVDTFVSADSPLESRRFAWAPLGAGAVLRALDSSNVTPPAVVRSLLALAEDHGLALQHGVTGGGNDGAVFTRHGAVDVPVSWPMRNSHSTAETIDLRDVEALAELVRLVATEWEPPSDPGLPPLP